MANDDAHIVLHCFVFPLMGVVGDQTGGQAGEDGDEEVKPKGFVNVTFAYSGKEVWEKILAIPFRAL